MEIWKPITGYEGYYEVSSHGRVRSVPRLYSKRVRGGILASRLVGGQVLKPSRNGKYLTVSLHGQNGRKTHAVHKLVALEFVPNPDHLPQVNHKDEDKWNNRVDNLEWCTSSYNTTYGTIRERKSIKLSGESNPRSRLTTTDVRMIRERAAHGESYDTLAVEFGVTRDTIYQIVTRRRWSNVE